MSKNILLLQKKKKNILGVKLPGVKLPVTKKKKKKKKNPRNHFSGIICVQMAVLTNLTIILKNGVIIRKNVAGNVSVQNFVKFKSVVFEILMKMCFDFSISKAHIAR